MNKHKPTEAGTVYVGCAGWSIPKPFADRFPGGGSHLERYAGALPAVEINSSFYRPHRPATYARWAESVPAGFRFAVKVPKVISHERRLVGVDDLLDRFLAEATHLGEKLGPLLVQLPPSLAYSPEVAKRFFEAWRSRFEGDVALEPRHPTWFEPDAERLAADYRIARVAADPAVVGAAGEPGGWNGLAYFRLHGTPKMYYSAYSREYLEALAAKLSRFPPSTRVWCVFDNTALGEATANALELLARLRRVG